MLEALVHSTRYDKKEDGGGGTVEVLGEEGEMLEILVHSTRYDRKEDEGREVVEVTP